MRLKMLTEANSNDLIEITTEWMAKTYREMNHVLFNDSLGGCEFGVFTTGKGMYGGTLGWFKMDVHNVKMIKSTRKMFIYDFLGEKYWIDRYNFEELCHPKILLNGNYKWTEKAALSTMVHEMCHYYCYMDGHYPKQAHGAEFRSIAQKVSNKSNDFFTVQRLASAEEMNEVELDADIKARIEKNRENKVNRMIPLLVFRKDGEVWLINCCNVNLVYEILAEEKKEGKSRLIVTVNDDNFKELLLSNGYKKAMRTYCYWSVEQEDWLKNINQYKLNVLFIDDVQSHLHPQPYGANGESNLPRKDEIPRFDFRINTNSGVFELKNVSEEELRKKLRERFPAWSEAALENIASNLKYRR